MSEIPSNLKYTKTHEWVEMQDDGSARVGITDHAQELLGDMVYIELPEVGQAVIAGEECAVVESVKAASDVYAPVSGEIEEVNEALNDNPELVNQSSYDDGWLFTIKPSSDAELDDLLDSSAYSDISAEEEH